MPTFMQTSCREVSTKVADANHEKGMSRESFRFSNHLDMSRWLQRSPWQVCNKPVCVALMEFSPSQCTGKVGDKVWKVCNNMGLTDWLRTRNWSLFSSQMGCDHWPEPGIKLTKTLRLLLSSTDCISVQAGN